MKTWDSIPIVVVIHSSQNHVCFEFDRKQLLVVLQIHILVANKVPNSSKIHYFFILRPLMTRRKKQISHE
jgi:hypothetical protein